MKFRPIAADLALTLVASGGAFAQTTAASGSDATLAGPGLVIGTAALMPLKYVDIQNSDLLTSKLVGLDIYNKQNEDISTISDVGIGGGKSVIGIVASVGGFAAPRKTIALERRESHLDRSRPVRLAA